MLLRAHRPQGEGVVGGKAAEERPQVLVEETAQG